MTKLSELHIDTIPNTTFESLFIAQDGTCNALIHTAGVKHKST